MSEVPYTPLAGKIPDYFAKIQEAGIPDSVNKEFLKQIGFASGNDYYIVRVLKYIGFVNDSGEPTDYWKAYKSPINGPSVLAEAIRSGYSSLFKIYPDAYRKDREAIYSVFSSTGKAEKTIKAMVNTFFNLVALADFDTQTEPILKTELAQNEVEKIVEVTPTKHISTKLQPDIHINIQLVLPETDDVTVYDKLFESMKKHLLTPNDPD